MKSPASNAASDEAASDPPDVADSSAVAVPAEDVDSAAAPKAAKTADDRWEFPPHGSVRYNFKASNLVAHCTFHSDNCRRSRTTKAHVNASRFPGQGRPMGNLIAWLDQADKFATAKEHSSQCKPTLQERREARQKLNSSPEAMSWAAKYERQPRANEEDEPPTLT